MSKAIIVFGSTSGNCEELAGIIADTATGKGLEVVLKNVTETSVDELQDYDLILLGSSTWGDGELQDDFYDFDADMSNISLADKKVAVFGCGDSGMDDFCGAVTLIESRVKSCGAALTTESLRVDGDIVREDAVTWAEKAVE